MICKTLRYSYWKTMSNKNFNLHASKYQSILVKKPKMIRANKCYRILQLMWTTVVPLEYRWIGSIIITMVNDYMDPFIHYVPMDWSIQTINRTTFIMILFRLKKNQLYVYKFAISYHSLRGRGRVKWLKSVQK